VENINIYLESISNRLTESQATIDQKCQTLIEEFLSKWTAIESDYKKLEQDYRLLEEEKDHLKRLYDEEFQVSIYIHFLFNPFSLFFSLTYY
jgi:regulator of replication initiation timing